ncbi:hypothetical protein O4160_21840 [Rhodococcus sp. IEGM 1401]|uniref:hypothetical protein n=1 Tax=Nocardiaceae TaxID=85025 RepID=UPI001E6483B9|nr:MULTISPECIES: hypothetical protein [Rhodococcus]MCJ0895209.1 hypothetical protein [Rhodococcus sp. ARC_M5]MCJ0980901.1 hypothetical protein [Rhodococcus sp. ARC_M12]MCX6490264.1 hypothetical protein [Rhodococcus sp. (in: high G+C Gram-positive bacteria)]MCZ4563486.1 hypothetical protein [Rhodococcus sp. IEGM 1401]MDI9923609.1 hypothetical protein [Rhodococcus sp. IEGM 1372]
MYTGARFDCEGIEFGFDGDISYSQCRDLGVWQPGRGKSEDQCISASEQRRRPPCSGEARDDAADPSCGVAQTRCTQRVQSRSHALTATRRGQGAVSMNSVDDGDATTLRCRRGRVGSEEPNEQLR